MFVCFIIKLVEKSSRSDWGSNLGANYPSGRIILGANYPGTNYPGTHYQGTNYLGMNYPIAGI
jgi:hypothetical protein